MHLFLFDFVFLVEECSGEVNYAEWWTLLRFCPLAFLHDLEMQAIDQAGILFAQHKCCIHNSSPTKVAVNTGKKEERDASMTE